jgi:hypothetical protein
MITLTRTAFNQGDTIGRMHIDGVLTTLWTLELPYGNGLPGSCIPDGSYPVVLAPSPKFQASADPWVRRYADRMPHILQIPNRTDILIHWGNSVDNTNGCVLVGLTHPTEEFIGSSRQAFELLWRALDGQQNISINVTSFQPQISA